MDEHSNAFIQSAGYRVLDAIGEGAYGVVWFVLCRLSCAEKLKLQFASQLSSAYADPAQCRYQEDHSV